LICLFDLLKDSVVYDEHVLVFAKTTS